MHRACVLVLSCAAATIAVAQEGDRYPANYVAGSLIQLNDNGAWSWFMDPRAIVHDGKLIRSPVHRL